jgi:N-methylhydantoinase A
MTDAMAVCGFLGHAPLAYNALSMDRARAEAAVGAVAQALGRGLQPTAEAIMQVAISEMFVEVNKLIARFGVDPRDFTLMPFGGAGPMLGCFLARELGIGAIMVPRRPGVVCALGGLIADVKSDFIRTVFVEAVPAALPGIRHRFADLRREAETWLRDEHGFAGPAVATLSADMRYHGQSFEIEVVLDEAWIAAGDIDAMRDAFHHQHLAIYDFNDKAGEIQIVNLRLVIAGTTAPPTLIDAEPALGEAVPEREVEIWLDGALRRVPLYLRAALQRGHRIVGPTIIVQEDTTVCIPPGFAGHVDRHLNLQLTAEA